MTLRDLQPVLAHASRNRDQAMPLGKLARLSRMSPSQFHRAFSAIAGETPKQFNERLRLDYAAMLLLSTKRSVLDIALASGYQSPEVFLRAFRRRFHTTPRLYRKHDPVPEASAGLIEHIGPCIHLYHHSQKEPSSMPYAIEVRQLSAQLVVSMRKRVQRSEIGPTIASSLGVIIPYCMQHGCAPTGHPVTRYSEMGAGMVTMEPSFRVSQHPPADPKGEILNLTLPAGPAAVTTHMGPYEEVHAAYAALEVWMHENGYKPSGAPWEDYVTDPAETPDTSKWRTDVYWPVAKAEGGA